MYSVLWHVNFGTTNSARIKVSGVLGIGLTVI